MANWTIVKAPSNGQPIQVIRPKNGAEAVHLAKVAIAKQDPEALDAIPERPGAAYIFVGYLAKDKKGRFALVNHKRERIGKIEPGDSMVTGAVAASN